MRARISGVGLLLVLCGCGHAASQLRAGGTGEAIPEGTSADSQLTRAAQAQAGSQQDRAAQAPRTAQQLDASEAPEDEWPVDESEAADGEWQDEESAAPDGEWADDSTEAPGVRGPTTQRPSGEALSGTLPNDSGTSDTQPVSLRGSELKRTRADQLVIRARTLVGRKTLKRYTRPAKLNDDCSGFVQLLYGDLDVDLLARASASHKGSLVKAIHQHAKRVGALHRKKPRPGDLVFFRETYDQNRDRRRNDGLTHIGIVETVDADGTVVFVHRATSGVRRSMLNLKRPSTRFDQEGKVLNEYIRPATRTQAGGLTGKLFAGFARADVLIAAAKQE